MSRDILITRVSPYFLALRQLIELALILPEISVGLKILGKQFPHFLSKIQYYCKNTFCQLLLAVTY